MPIKQSGSPLSLDEIYNEFKDRDNPPRVKDEGNVTHHLGEYYGVDIDVPSNGEIKFSDFYGKADEFVLNIPNKSNNAFYNNVDLVNRAIEAGWNGQAKLLIQISGKIKSTTTSTPAASLDFNTVSQGAPQRVIIQVNSSGAIIGRGGNGGGHSGKTGAAGATGGTGLYIRNKPYVTGDGSPWDGLEGQVIVRNEGYITGGGGGGGAMHNRASQHAGGGGGGAGAGNGGNQAGDGRSYTGGAGATTWKGAGSNGGGYSNQYGRGGGAGGGGGGYLAGQVGKGNDGAGAGGGGGLDPIDGTGGSGGSNSAGSGGNFNSNGGSSFTGGGGGFGRNGGSGDKSGGAAGKAIIVGGGTTTAYSGGGNVYGSNQAT